MIFNMASTTGSASGFEHYKDARTRAFAQQIALFDAKHLAHHSMMDRARQFQCELLLIDPRDSRWIGWWDLVTSLALIFTAIITPVEVGFMADPEDRWADPLFLTNRVVDMIFMIDMTLQFLLMVPSEGMDGSTEWLTEPKEIARRYVCSGWFFLDFFSIAVSGLDIFASGDSGVSQLKVLRALRVLRLLKLVRLLRGSRIFRRWENRLSINYGVLSIVNICVMLLFVCHLFACVWGLQASFDPLSTWLGANGYCVPYNVSQPCAEGWICDEVEGWSCVGAAAQYLYSLYWSIATVTSIGYGDVVATPLQGVEQLMCVSMMLTGSMLFAYLVGSFCGLAQNLAPDVLQFRQDLTNLNKFLNEHKIAHSLRYELREYMHQSVLLRRADTAHRLLREVAPRLRNEVALAINEKWLYKIDLLNKDCELGLILELAFALQLQIFPPGDSCPIGSIYIVSNGAALYAGKAYRAGQSWGEPEALLLSERLRFPIPATAHSYLFAYALRGDVLRNTMARPEYPEAAFRLRRRQLQWIVRRGVVCAAHEMMLASQRITERRQTRRNSIPRMGDVQHLRSTIYGSPVLGQSNKLAQVANALLTETRHKRLSKEHASKEDTVEGHSPSSSTNGSPALARKGRKERNSKERVYRASSKELCDTRPAGYSFKEPPPMQVQRCNTWSRELPVLQQLSAPGRADSFRSEGSHVHGSDAGDGRMGRLEDDVTQIKHTLAQLAKDTREDMITLRQMMNRMLTEQGRDHADAQPSTGPIVRPEDGRWSIGDPSMTC